MSTVHRSHAKVALIFGGLACLAMLLRLFAGGAVGLADNGDGHRLICQLGLRPAPMPDGVPGWAYANPYYEEFTWYGEACSAGGTGEPYLSTQALLLLGAKALTPLLGSEAALDLRALGILCALIFGVAIAVNFMVMPFAVWLRGVVVIGMALVVLDSTIATYFISPLSEPAGLLGTLFLIAALFRMLRGRRTTVGAILLVAFAALWCIADKTQTASYLVGTLLALFLRPAHFPWAGHWVQRLRDAGEDAAGQKGPVRPSRLGAVLRRGPAALISVGLLAVTVQFQGMQARHLGEIYTFHQLFVEILPNSPTPRQDLADLGLDPNWERYSGKNILTAPLVWSPEYEQMLHLRTADLVSFHLNHPDRLAGLADRGMVGLTRTRASYLGNYLADSGAGPYAKECRVCLVQPLLTFMRPIRWFVFPPLVFGAAVFGAVTVFRRRSPLAARAGAAVVVVFAASTVVQFWAVMVTDGSNDLDKHMIFTLYGLTLMGPLLVATVLTSLGIGSEPGASSQMAALPRQKKASAPASSWFGSGRNSNAWFVRSRR
ncbi:glycan biosynthesis hexose transferase WsfD [Streptomyces sp. NBC_01304]|uniref:glycan biosynthesis hexose transferase WsfD n=1 Tax=Streptomyces sp. NBC_01304 TaxID=2903818 RepID=UPI002E0FEB3D|nr:hypothetical protein OG430_42220 [Streptomyces sp. NBC_01304]